MRKRAIERLHIACSTWQCLASAPHPIIFTFHGLQVGCSLCALPAGRQRLAEEVDQVADGHNMNEDEDEHQGAYSVGQVWLSGLMVMHQVVSRMQQQLQVSTPSVECRCDVVHLMQYLRDCVPPQEVSLRPVEQNAGMILPSACREPTLCACSGECSGTAVLTASEAVAKPRPKSLSAPMCRSCCSACSTGDRPLQKFPGAACLSPVSGCRFGLF